ncbi:MAG: amino acid permease [Candidatus Aenigmarchaeota archaeon]|nr:amino acid permease [Candidatus Aenigmarchaeota archaeon]
MPKLKRELNVFYLVMIGIANIIGAGIFVVSGVAAGIAGPSVVISFFIASLAALFTGLSLAELSSAITQTGESYTYSRKAFGNSIGFVVGLIKMMNNVLSVTAVTMGFSIFLISFFFPSLNSFIYLFTVSSLVILLSTYLNIVDISKMSKVATFLTLVKIFAISFFITLGLFYVKDNFDPQKLQPVFPNGLSGTFHAASMVFFAYIGFQVIAMATEEAKNPKRDIPAAILFSIFICYVLYSLVALVQVLVVDWQTLGKVENSVLYVTQKITDNYFVSLFMIFSILSAMLSVIITTIYSGSRLFFAFSRDGFIPKSLCEVDKKYKTPVKSILLLSFMSILCLFINDINLLISIVSFGYLLTFLLTNLSLIKLKKKIKPKFELPFHPWIPILGAISTILLIISLDNVAKIAGLAFVLLSFLIYFLFVKRKLDKNVFRSTHSQHF